METFESAILPVLGLQDTVLFPGAVSPLFVVREQGLAAIESALKGDKRLFISLERRGKGLAEGTVHEVGTVAEVLQVLRVPDGSAKILAEGLYVARAVDFIEGRESAQALLVRQDVVGMDSGAALAFCRTTLSLFEDYARGDDRVTDDLLASIRQLDEPLAFVHAVANYTALKPAEKQAILEQGELEEKFLQLNTGLEALNQASRLEDQIVNEVRNRIGRSQRDYYLNEQLKIIEKELGIDGEHNEIEELERQLDAAGLPAAAREKADRELRRLARMAPTSPEATVARSYIEWLVEVPWHHATPDRIDLDEARRILDREHHGLEKVKERIIEYLAVTKLAGSVRGPILCLVGPPGVGKTTLARSVASCIDRQFVRISLGGVRDEAEIRGHRRTYIGALPGKIIQSMKKAGAINPVFLLDEIDKMSSDFRGDPAAALLEVLDPEQNTTFNDHYLEVDYDLSRVLFIATANTTAGIPPALQDRMEVIHLTGYTNIEKMHIARRHLVPRAIRANGLRARQVRFTAGALHSLIDNYTKEAGVRNLEREINSVCRKVATGVVRQQSPASTTITEATVREFLGPERYRDTAIEPEPEVGNTIGLAWTEAGGEILHVECRTMPGKGELRLTGTLGEVMKESAATALSYIRSQAAEMGVDPAFHEKVDVHIHLPEGAIPKDGPSAGITLATSLVSVLSGRPVRQDIAMTGEVTLRGRVLKIGGLKEKALAAYRNHIRLVIIPEENLVDVAELPVEVRRRIEFLPVRQLREVLEIAFARRQRATPARRPGAKAPRPHGGHASA
jgi:ATP-dependent Lon protease